MEQRRLSVSLASFVLIGVWATACGDGSDSNNQVPVLTGPTVQSADVTSGTAVALSLEATDADGDSLTYEWVQTPASPAGTFSDATLPNPTWTAPTVTAATSFQLGVTVSDGKERHRAALRDGAGASSASRRTASRSSPRARPRHPRVRDGLRARPALPLRDGPRR